MTNQDIITELLKWEGSKFTDDPLDRGGATKFGITQPTLSRYAGIEATREDVKNLTEEVARKIYLKLYIEEPNFDKIIHPELRHLIVDAGVNHGPRRAVQLLQEALDDERVVVDGILGPITLKEVNIYTNPTWTYNAFLKKRILYYAKIVRNDLSQAKWLVGWMRRATSFLV